MDSLAPIGNTVAAAVTAIPKVAVSTVGGAVVNTAVRGFNSLDDCIWFGHYYNPISNSSRPWWTLDKPYKEVAFAVAKVLYPVVHIPSSLATGCLLGATRGLAEGVASVIQNRPPSLGASLDFLCPRSSPWMWEQNAYNRRWF